MEDSVLFDIDVIDEILVKTEHVGKEIEALRLKHDGKCLGKWLDKQDVCLILCISPRKLQTYRDEGKIGFTRISHKIYYKPEDIESFIQKCNNNNLKNNSYGNDGQ